QVAQVSQRVDRVAVRGVDQFPDRCAVRGLVIIAKLLPRPAQGCFPRAPAPSRPRPSRASAALIPRASHAAATTQTAPARAAGKAPSQLPTRIFPPNGTGTTATIGDREPPWWLRNSSQIAG